MRKRNLFDDDSKKSIKDYRIFYRKHEKLFWALVFTPPLILTSLLGVTSIMNKNRNGLTVTLLISSFFSGIFCMTILLSLLDVIQATTRNFIHEDKKAKLVSIIIFSIFVLKELASIHYSHHH